MFYVPVRYRFFRVAPPSGGYSTRFFGAPLTRPCIAGWCCGMSSVIFRGQEMAITVVFLFVHMQRDTAVIYSATRWSQFSWEGGGTQYLAWPWAGGRGYSVCA